MSEAVRAEAAGIGTLGEKSLHAGLKAWYGQPGDRFEVKVDGYIVDIVRQELLIEIQTRHLYRLKRKLGQLLKHHPVMLVYPIAEEKWIERQTTAGEKTGRRRSPKHGRAIDVFAELARCHELLSRDNLTLELLLTQQEEIWRDDGRGSWRRQHWSVYDRRLLQVNSRYRIESRADLGAMLPAGISEPFTNAELATALSCRRNLAGKMTYTLRQLDVLATAGRRGNALLYERKR